MIQKRFRRFILIGILLITFSQANSASALLIGTSEYKGGMFTANPILISSVDVTPFFTTIFPSASLGYQLFGTITINSTSIGNQYSININDPNFGDAASLLTNNVDDFIGTKTMFNYSATPPVIYLSGVLGAGHESGSLSGLGFNGTDFYGSTIDNIVLTVESFSSDYAFNPRIGTGVSTEYSYRIEYEQTPVPEPSTIFLLGSGLIGVVIFRRRKKKMAKQISADEIEPAVMNFALDIL